MRIVLVTSRLAASVTAIALLAWFTPGGWPSSPDPSRANVTSAASATPTSDIQFVLDETYLFDETIDVKVSNTSDEPYRYSIHYAACGLSYFDSWDNEFIVPPGTRCDVFDEGEIAPGETVKLFDWSLDQCLIDDWGCVWSRPLLPGLYRITGQFQTASAASTAQAEFVIRIARPGDADCDNYVTSVDALATLRSVAGLSPLPGECSDLDDVDCDGSISSADALSILRNVASLSVAQPAGCPVVGYPNDTDGDGVIDQFESEYGSDPIDPGSTPEHFFWYRSTCWDGTDNDGDGLTDVDDPGEASSGNPFLHGCGGNWDSSEGRNAEDNCPLNPNPDQADANGDGSGDDCDWQRWYI